ncbi:MAG: hypothetical protein HN370_00005 [Phycisphaerales bacterium]|jgi:hypothetical protein|nr:hypothetical protein [Phycisphaerales bacterium]
MNRRKSTVEGSFGDAATHHGFKRARWRRRWRMKIQNLMIAALQNLRKLLKYGRRTPKRVALGLQTVIVSQFAAMRASRRAHTAPVGAFRSQ